MSTLYESVSTHAILSPTAKALNTNSPTSFVAQQELAEVLLGLTPPAITDAFTLDRIRLALALQINFQLAQGIDPLIEETTQSTHSSQFVRYRDRVLNPQAAAIVAEIVTSGLIDNFAVLTSLRTQ